MLTIALVVVFAGAVVWPVSPLLAIVLVAIVSAARALEIANRDPDRPWWDK